MKKKLISVLCVLVVLVLAATLIGPYVILNAVRQPEVAESYDYSDTFYESYEQIRAHLQDLT